jgi:hypothetical protein
MDKYALLQQIGAGAFAQVFKGFGPTLPGECGDVALKRIEVSIF